MKIKMKNQNGAISLFVLLSMMFFLAFMLGAFTLVNRRNIAQIEALAETKKIYSSGRTADEIYDSIFQTVGTSAVPITNIDQLHKVKDAAGGVNTYKYLINGKIYTYAKDTNYVLQNDIILDLEDTINDSNYGGRNQLYDSLYDYVLYNSSYRVNTNGHSIYYQKDDNSIWKLVCYHYIGTDSDNDAYKFDKNSGGDYYYGKSYDSKRFSILENGISAYANNWLCNDNSIRKFEFMLMYTSGDNQQFDASKYNRWRQTNDPAKDQDTSDKYPNGDYPAAGYTINFEGGTTEGLGEGNYWGGLVRARSSDNTYLDGSVGHTNWFFAVGSTKWHSTYGIPSSTATGGSAREGLLFVRYK